uniref:Zinc finger BED domain-containing protein RICESLEEPER 2-like n=1 Tax=Tanacetum cinerariifolium TaxID=118510 RepID=A0A6L2N1W3_TANCI|nr:zinc finger BED domain-containing protein RICESLEEPER 2-like [Tanacetum cinerariifolium]
MKIPRKPRERKPGGSSTRNFWTQDEELLLAECYIQISEDPNVGSKQKNETLWYKVLDAYNEQAKKNEFPIRTKKMLTKKWTLINREVGKFNSIVKETNALSGEKDDDLMTMEDVESVNHIFFSCEMAKALWDLFAKWWELDILFCDNIFNWFSWLDSLKAFNKASHGNQVTSLLKRLKEHNNKKARSDPSLSSEYEQYVHSDFVTRLQTTSISTDLNFFDDSYATKAKNDLPTRSKASHGNQVTSLLKRLKQHNNKKARSDPSLSSEYEQYVHSDFVTHLQTTEFETFDVLGFWKAKETMFPVLSRMAMDILSVQATSVASESAFSTSEMVLSIRRTRLTSASLEMSNVMSEPGSGGEEAEAEANYGYDVYYDDY